VTVDITAQRGAGNLLGNLLSSVAHLLDTPAFLNGLGINNKLSRIASLIAGL
jgi:hypothetical protein